MRLLRRLAGRWRMRKGAWRFPAILLRQDGSVEVEWGSTLSSDLEDRWIRLWKRQRETNEILPGCHPTTPLAYILRGEVRWLTLPTLQEQLLVAAVRAALEGRT